VNTGVVNGVVSGATGTKVLSGIWRWEGSATSGAFFFYTLCGYQSAGSVWLSVAEDSVKKAKETEATLGR
jgi:hypothetical protein